MKPFLRATTLRRSALLMLAVVAPLLGITVSQQNGGPAVTLGGIPTSYAECEGPPPQPDWDACGNPPTPTPTPTPTQGHD